MFKVVSLSLFAALTVSSSFASSDPFRPELFAGNFKLDMSHSDPKCMPQARDAGGPADQYFVFESIIDDRARGTGFVSFDSVSDVRPQGSSLTGLSDAFSSINESDPVSNVS